MGFVLFAVAFVALLTVLVRVRRLRVRGEIGAGAAYGLTVGFVAFLVGAWWFVTSGATPEDRLVNRLIIPSPAEVLAAFPTLHFEQALVRGTLTSWLRVTEGFALAAFVAIPLGVYMASFSSVSAVFRPLALIGSYVPIVCMMPLTFAWWGLTEMQKVGFLFVASFVALLPLVIKSIEDVASPYLDVAVTKGATQWQLVRHVLVPVAAADIWDHMRGIYGVGWGWIVLTEMTNSEQGLGHLIDVSNRRSHQDAIYAVIIVIVLVGLVCDRLWRLGGVILFPYRRRSA